MSNAEQVEQLLISSILLNKDMKNALAHGLSRQMFYSSSREYNWLEDFWMKNGKEPAVNSFKVQFPRFVVVTCDDTTHFVERVREEYMKRQVLTIIEEASDRMTEPDTKTEDILSYLHSNILTVNQDMGLIDDGDIFVDNIDVLEDFEQRRIRFAERGYSGVPTGFWTIDSRGGFDIGLTIIAARTGGRKSWFMQKAAASAAEKGFRVQFNALEQTRSQVAARVYSLMNDPQAEKQYASQQLLQGRGYDPDDFRHYLAEVKKGIKTNGGFHVADASRGGVSVATIASQIERNKPDIVFVDYLSLMSMESYDWQGLERTAAELTQLANKYQIPIVVAMQLNRNGAQKDASVETLAGSDGPGRYASLIVFLRKPSESVIEVSVEKARDYSGGFGFYCKFRPDKAQFHEIEYDVAMALIENDKENEADLEEAK